MPMEKEEFTVKAYNTTELAGHYRVSSKTFRRWLRRLNLNLGTRTGNFFSPRQVQIIIDHLGRPFVWLGMIAMRIVSREVMDDDLDEESRR